MPSETVACDFAMELASIRSPVAAQIGGAPASTFTKAHTICLVQAAFAYGSRVVCRLRSYRIDEEAASDWSPPLAERRLYRPW